MFTSYPSEDLADVLLDHHLLPTARWLLGTETTLSSEYLLPQAANSNWECALAVWYLLDLYPKLDKDDALRAQIQSKVPATISWMVHRTLPEDLGQSWEHVTWDTAICIRSVLRAVGCFPKAFSNSEQQLIDATAVNVMAWMFDRFAHWNTDVLYPFGPADVAQICDATVYLAGVNRRLLDRAATMANEASVEVVLERMVMYLMAQSEQKALAVVSGPAIQPHAFWGDVFQSSEVAEALVGYLGFVSTSQFKGSCDISLVRRCRAAVVDVFRYLEDHQADGRWGGHAETCRAMQAYLRCSTAIPEISPQPEVVLKGIRWMCDPKQAFDDGSFLHTTYATVFYALALWQVYDTWPPAGDAVIHVYDRALWATAVHSSVERGRRLELEIQCAHLSDDAEVQRRRYGRLRRSGQAAVGFAVTVFLAVIVSNLVGLTAIHNPIHIKTDGDIAGYLVLVAALAIAAGGAAYKLDWD